MHVLQSWVPASLLMLLLLWWATANGLWLCAMVVSCSSIMTVIGWKAQFLGALEHAVTQCFLHDVQDGACDMHEVNRLLPSIQRSAPPNSVTHVCPLKKGVSESGRSSCHIVRLIN
jgi:hypothetical protein